MSTQFEHQALVFEGTDKGPFVTATRRQYDELLAWQADGWMMFATSVLHNGHLMLSFRRAVDEGHEPSPPAHWGLYL